MARLRCPSCGAVYQGKKCPECLYAPFDTDIESFSLHSAPLRPERRAYPQNPPMRPRTVREPEEFSRPRSAPAGRRTRNNYGRRLSRRLSLLVILIIMAASALPNVMLRIIDSAIDDSVEMEMPETTIPVDYNYVLYDADGIRIKLAWDGGPIEDDLLICAENDTDEDIKILCPFSSVNDIMIEEVLFYFDVPARSSEESYFWLSSESMEKYGIESLEKLSTYIHIIDEDYNDLIEPTCLTFGPGGSYTMPEPEGVEVYNANGFRLLYQGLEVQGSGSIYIRLYGVNETDEMMNVYTSQVSLGGEEAEVFMAQLYFPQAQGSCNLGLYDSERERLGIEGPEDLEDLEMVLWIVPRDDQDAGFETDPIYLDLS